MTDHSLTDYALADTLELDDPRQYRALFEPTRAQICSLLLERAATTSELAEVLGKPKGTVGHHLKRVRALEAKYYGRTARVFFYDRAHDAIGQEERVLGDTIAGVRAALERNAHVNVNVRHARISRERLDEWNDRMHQLLFDFAAERPEGDVTYALTFALYATDRPPLRTPESH